MQAVWKGRIQFGPVDVPVKLYSAVSDIAVHSHLLHDQDNIRLEQKMVCSQEGKVVPDEEYAKGYKVTNDEYVVIEPDELDFIQFPDSRQIQVMEFVDISQLDDRFLARTYYLGPDNDDQLYTNLIQSLKDTKLAGICKWVMRKKSYVGVMNIEKDIITLTVHRFFSEIINPETKEFKNEKISARENEIAKNLINELKDKFHPEKYHDEYQAKLQNLIELKAKGKKVTMPHIEKARETKDKELLNVLEKSLASLKHK